MKEVGIKKGNLTRYTDYLDGQDKLIFNNLSEDLRGLRVAFVNSTSFGGGVAELFYSIVPLLKASGVDIHWYTIDGDKQFFNITKKLHNMLQGKEGTITTEEREYYTLISAKNAEAFNEDFDVVVVHDPQPMALPMFSKNKRTKWLWRCHVDTSAPFNEAHDFAKQFLPLYNETIFSTHTFAKGMDCEKNSTIIYPSIDPFSEKNRELSEGEIKNVISKFGVDPSKPIILQVSRFDPWKDPIGVTDVYRSVKKKIPDVQLVLIGSMATDDPEGWGFYERTLRHAGEDKDIFIFTNFDGVGSTEVNAFQRSATVMLQKSIREGFGLTVSEALWKWKATVGGNVGGIKLQIEDGKSGYLVNSDKEAVDKVEELLVDKAKREKFGQEGHRTVAKKFLTTRHILDYLKLFKKLVN